MSEERTHGGASSGDAARPNGPLPEPARPEPTVEYSPEHIPQNLAFELDSNPPRLTESVERLLAGDHQSESSAGPARGENAAARAREPNRRGETAADSSLPERYRVAGEIARGGMGAILLGRDRSLGRDVAIKVMLERHVDRADMRRRFVEEARITGQLQHPGIAPIYELGSVGERRPYFTMKLIQGRTLAQLLGDSAAAPGGSGAPAQPRPGLARLLGIFEQVCQTVAYAHARGVIHRDLKPANIMVGNFGEVQVMDWGLAKVLGGEKHATQAPSDSAAAEAPSTADDGATRVGSVMGTPAYMAPEQARGAVDELDERCDVFSLGAVLCEILTGSPPYQGPDTSVLFQRAVQADLAEAEGRLDRCGADPPLVALAKQCLRPAKADRPGNAGAVARATTDYLVSTQERLRQAEVERAEAVARADAEEKRRQAEQARADAEEKRRRLEQARAQSERYARQVSVALFAALALLVAGVGAAAWWYQQGQLAVSRLEAAEARHESERTAEEARRQGELLARTDAVALEVNQALDDATANLDELQSLLDDPLTAAPLLSDPQPWYAFLQTAKVACKRARFQVDGNQELVPPPLQTRLAAVEKAVQAGEQGYGLAEQLDGIRLGASTLVEGKLNPAQAGPLYETAFAKAMGLNLRTTPPEAAADTIRRSPIRYGLVAAIDHWAMVTPDVALRDRLLQAARLADPDPWRDRVRDSKSWGSLSVLQGLAGEANPEQQSPQILILLAFRLESAGGNKDAVTLLRRSQVHFPGDFWIHFFLGNIVRGTAERAGAYQAALAVRPRNAAAHNNLGMALQDGSDLAGAIAHYEAALGFAPNFLAALNNLGVALHASGKVDAAAERLRRAIELAPDYGKAHNNLGIVLYSQKDFAAAIKQYETALKLEPKRAEIHNNLGNALRAGGDMDAAVAEYRRAIALDAKYAEARFNLGTALYERKDMDGALAALAKAVELDPRHADAHNNLGIVLKQQGDLKGAIAHYRKAIESDRKLAKAHFNLGNALAAVGDVQGAVRSYQAAVALQPGYGLAHAALGKVLLTLGRFAEARQASEQALKRTPHAAPYREMLQVQLQQAERLATLEHRAEQVIRRQAPVKSVDELSALVDFCLRDKHSYSSAAKLYAAAFDAAPQWAESDDPPLRLRAAYAAALAGTGQGKDAETLTKAEQAALRKRAYAWLTEELKKWQRRAGDDPRLRPTLVKQLVEWQTAPQFAGVRNASALDALPAAEGEQWRQIWLGVQAAIRKAKAM